MVKSFSIKYKLLKKLKENIYLYYYKMTLAKNLGVVNNINTPNMNIIYC